MKFGSVTKLDKENTTASKKKKKKIGNDILLINYDAIVIFAIYASFRAIRNLDSGRMVYDFYIFINNNILSYKM